MRTIGTISLALLALAGCAQTQKVDAPVTPTPIPDRATLSDFAPAQPDPAIPVPSVIDVTFIQCSAPMDSISRNKEFWRRINEPVVDVQTNDTLYENGIHIGEGTVADWPQFKKLLDAAGATAQQSHFIGVSAKDQEFAATGELASQTLFYFDHEGRLSGRVYDDCQNLFGLSYGPAPREASDVRLELCPFVRGTRRHYAYTLLNGEESVDYVSDEQLYDAGLRVDLPPDQFLIVAPSPASERTMSLGHQFLTQDGKSGRRETILIFAVTHPSVRFGAATQPVNFAK